MPDTLVDYDPIQVDIDILEGIKTYLTECGWTQWTMGQPGQPACLHGAARIVTIGVPSAGWARSSEDELNQMIAATADIDEWLNEQLAPFIGGLSVVTWNDKRYVDQQIVLRALDCRINELRERQAARTC